jgi:hypothetical protein
MLAQALEAEGFKSTNQGYSVPEAREATCLISGAGEILSVGRLVRIELQASFLKLATAKEEHFFFAYEDVLGLRVLSAPAAKERSAGFGR